MATDILEDVLAQPAMLTQALEAHLTPGSALEQAVKTIQRIQPRRIVFTGMGSSFFAAYPAFLRLHGAGWPVSWLELAELLHFDTNGLTPDTLLVIISQSGETIEAVRLLNERPPAGPVLGITNAAESTLGRKANYVVPTLAGQEKTVATRTYTAALLVLGLLAEQLLGVSANELRGKLAGTLVVAEKICAQASELIGGLAPEWLDPAPLTLIGRGPSYATAISGALALKETAKIPAEGATIGQFRHGPIEIAGPGHRAIVCAGPGPTRALDLGMVTDLRKHGSRVLLLGPVDQGSRTDTIEIPDVAFSPLVEIMPLQLIAREMALRQGIEPGSFRYIGKVTLAE